MKKCVCMGAKLKCMFGTGPKSMMVLPIARVMNTKIKSIAGQLDIIPILNIPPFGTCLSPLNPMNWKMIGPIPVFIPGRCLPIPIMPWAPVAKKLKIGKKPAMLQNSKTMCVWMGQITVQKPGITNVQTK